MERLEGGLEKLKSTATQVDDLKEKLKAQEVELKQKNEDADALIEKVGVEQEKVGAEKAIADEEEKKVAKINTDVSKKQKDCETDLAKAEPALKAAEAALNTLNKANLTELKSFGKPPPAVVNVTAAVMVLCAPSNKIPKDRGWNNAKIMMGKVKFPAYNYNSCASKNIFPCRWISFWTRLSASIRRTLLTVIWQQYDLILRTKNSILTWSDPNHLLQLVCVPG